MMTVTIASGHATFDAAQMSGVGQTICVAMPTQNVSDLEAIQASSLTTGA